MNVDHTEKYIITLKETTVNDVSNTHNNKHNQDEQMKDSIEG